jgi:predicted ATP-grasp superfamily ATP-dependent carboligase
MAFRSRHVQGSFVYPSPFTAQDEFLSCIREKGHELGVTVLVPVLEEGFLIAKHAASLSDQFHLAVPSYDTLLSVHDKVRLARACRQHGVRTPKTVTFRKLAEDNHLLKELRFPVMIKPRQGGGGWAVRECTESGQVLEILEKGNYLDLPLERFFVQEKIKGNGICFAVLYDVGVCVATVGYRQVRNYPVGYGQSTFRVGVDCPAAKTQMHKLLDALSWHGVCQGDFLLEEETGTPYLTDVNPRFWGSTGHSIAAGVDIPLMYYRIAVGLPYQPADRADTSAKSRWLGGDLMSFFGTLRKAEHKTRFVKDFIFSGATYYDDFSLSDPLPFFAWGFQKVAAALGVGRGQGDDVLEGIWE